ncbi:MAG: cell division protein FtsQ/DivIB [Polaromonas sp.]|nr:cell division protein FtsQ/DivIB [Polaromonas sp.]
MSRAKRIPFIKALPLDVRLMNNTAAAFLLLFGALSLTAVAGWLAKQPVFSLKAIHVENELAHNNAATLRANVAPKLAGNFFTLDLARTRSAFENVPWVRYAVVRREFPDSLRVELQEHQAVAFWGPASDAQLVNSFGEVFEVNQGDVEAEDLPLLNGPKGQSALVLQGYRAVAPMLEKVDIKLTELELTHRGSWRALLEGGAVIEMGLGSPAEIQVRVQRFVATVAQTSSKFGRNLESADLRYSNGYAIKLRGVTTVAAGSKQNKK